jgi:FlaA1/EpsC-like NDP-sugar epimerase
MIWDIFYTSFGLYLAADLIGYKNFSRLIEQTQKRIQCVLNSETLEINKPHNFNDLDIEGNMMMIPLQGKVAIVTGAGRGIGAATAKILASRGANVIVNFVKDGESAKKVVAPIETSDNANDTNNNNNNNNSGRGKAFAKSRCYST